MIQPLRDLLSSYNKFPTKEIGQPYICAFKNSTIHHPKSTKFCVSVISFCIFPNIWKYGIIDIKRAINSAIKIILEIKKDNSLGVIKLDLVKSISRFGLNVSNKWVFLIQMLIRFDLKTNLCLSGKPTLSEYNNA